MRLAAIFTALSLLSISSALAQQPPLVIEAEEPPPAYPEGNVVSQTLTATKIQEIGRNSTGPSTVSPEILSNIGSYMETLSSGVFYGPTTDDDIGRLVKRLQSLSQELDKSVSNLISCPLEESVFKIIETLLDNAAKTPREISLLLRKNTFNIASAVNPLETSLERNEIIIEIIKSFEKICGSKNFNDLLSKNLGIIADDYNNQLKSTAAQIDPAKFLKLLNLFKEYLNGALSSLEPKQVIPTEVRQIITPSEEQKETPKVLPKSFIIDSPFKSGRKQSIREWIGVKQIAAKTTSVLLGVILNLENNLIIQYFDKMRSGLGFKKRLNRGG